MPYIIISHQDIAKLIYESNHPSSWGELDPLIQAAETLKVQVLLDVNANHRDGKASRLERITALHKAYNSLYNNSLYNWDVKLARKHIAMMSRVIEILLNSKL